MPGIVTAITAPPSSQLTTLEAARFDLNIPDSSQDAYLTSLINRASAVVANSCNRVFGLQTGITETFRGGPMGLNGVLPMSLGLSGSLSIHAKRQPLVLTYDYVAITSVTESGVALNPATDFEVDAPAGLVYRLFSGFRAWWLNPLIVVTYNSGWNLPNDPTPTLPVDVQDCCLALVKSAYFARGRDPNLQMDTLDRDRTSFFERNINPMHIDEGMTAALSSYRTRVY